MNVSQFFCYHGCDVVFKYDFDHIQMYAIKLVCYHGGCECVVNIYIVVEGHFKRHTCMLVNKFLNLWKWMRCTNVFIRCSSFNMYVKHGNKKIWHEMITFVCGSKNYITMCKYNIVPFLGLIFVLFQFWCKF
jgi:hypothetical protein